MYKICSLRRDGWPTPQNVLPMKLLDALDYIEEYSMHSMSYNDIRICRSIDPSWEPLVVMRETRYDKIFENINYSTLLTDMLLYWDEYWDDWEYYDPRYRATKTYIDESDVFGIFGTKSCTI